MTKVIEAYCNVCWAGGKRVRAAHRDVPFTWGRPMTVDLCEEHHAEADGRLGWLVAVADRAPDGGPPARGRGRRPGGAVRELSDAEKDAVVAWADAGQIMARTGPPRLAYQKAGGGRYFPAWLVRQWDAQRAGQRPAPGPGGGGGDGLRPGALGG